MPPTSPPPPKKKKKCVYLSCGQKKKIEGTRSKASKHAKLTNLIITDNELFKAEDDNTKVKIEDIVEVFFPSFINTWSSFFALNETYITLVNIIIIHIHFCTL